MGRRSSRRTAIVVAASQIVFAGAETSLDERLAAVDELLMELEERVTAVEEPDGGESDSGMHVLWALEET